MGQKPSSKPTSFDIAYLAGVSQPTVSRALRGSKSVSLATREKIEGIARELNYSVDKNASSLRSQRSSTLALLFFKDQTPDNTLINPFFLSMLGSITLQCELRGLDLLISFQQMEDDWHVRYEDSHRADGLILLGYGDYTAYRHKLTQLIDHGTHFVRWGSADEESIGATVGSDNFGAGRLAGEYLIGLGRRNIGFLGFADEHYPEFADRYAGLAHALRDAGLIVDPALQVDAITTEEAGYCAAQTMLAAGSSFDALFAASDLIAIGALRALAEAGLRVPQDISVVGFDNIPAAAHTNPPLTTIMQDLRAGGELLVETLLAQINDEPVQPRKLPASLVVRASS